MNSFDIESMQKTWPKAYAVRNIPGQKNPEALSEWDGVTTTEEPNQPLPTWTRASEFIRIELGPRVEAALYEQEQLGQHDHKKPISLRDYIRIVFTKFKGGRDREDATYECPDPFICLAKRMNTRAKSNI